MLHLVSFGGRVRRPKAKLAHRACRIAFTVFAGILIFGWAVPSRAADQGLPTSDTPYGSGGAGASTGGSSAVQIGPQWDPKQCGPATERAAELSRQLAEIDKGQDALIRAARNYEAQLRSLRCVDVDDLNEPAKYKRCDRIRKARLAILRKVPLRNAEIRNIRNEQAKMNDFLVDCERREREQAKREGRPVGNAGDSPSSPSSGDRSNLLPPRSASADDVDPVCEFVFGWTLASGILCP